jgi:hypothetical protein
VERGWELIAGRAGDPLPREGTLFIVHFNAGDLTPMCGQQNAYGGDFRILPPGARTPDEYCMRCLRELGDPRQRVRIPRVPSVAEVDERRAEIGVELTDEQRARIAERRRRAREREGGG